MLSGLILVVALSLGLIWADSRLVSAYPVAQRFDALWQSARLWVNQGESPYFRDMRSPGVAAPRGNPTLPPLEGRFSAPFYTLFLLLPFALFEDSQAARVAWLVILQASLFLTALRLCQVTDWKPRRFSFALFLLAAVLGYHSIQSLLSGDTTILSALFIALGLGMLRDKRLELAGVFFALATIQPRLMILPAVFLLPWAASNRHWQFVAWFLGSLGVLSFLGYLFNPQWLLEYIRLMWQVASRERLVIPTTALAGFLPGIGRQLGVGMILFFSLVLLVEWALALRKGFHWFLWTFCLTLALSPWVGIPSSLQDFVVYLIPLALALSVLERQFAVHGRGLGMAILLGYLVLWWFLFSAGFPGGDSFRLQSQFMLITPLLFVVLMYWVRWRARRPPSSLLTDLRASIE